MTTPDPRRPRATITRRMVIHAIIALPWVFTGVVAVALAEADRRGFQVAGLAFAVPGVLLLWSRGGWLIAVACVGAILALVAGVGIGINYIDSSPTRDAAGLYGLLQVGTVGCLLAAVAAIVVGVAEIRAHRRSVGPVG